jgi:hypothetical protein
MKKYIKIHVRVIQSMSCKDQRTPQAGFLLGGCNPAIGENLPNGKEDQQQDEQIH